MLRLPLDLLPHALVHRLLLQGRLLHAEVEVVRMRPPSTAGEKEEPGRGARAASARGARGAAC